LGLNGPQEVKDHIWFRDYKWDDLLARRTKPPFVPPKEDNFDASYTNSEWKDNNDETIKQNTLLLRRNSVQGLFNGYYHDDNLAAISAKNQNGAIEEHVPSANSSTTHEPSNNNS
jgi:hypothetical protein